MRMILSISFFLLCGSSSFAQGASSDSLLNLLGKAKDSLKVNVLNELFFEYEYSDDKKAEEYLKEALRLSEQLQYEKGSAITHVHFGFLEEDRGNYAGALTHYKEALKIYEGADDQKNVAKVRNNMGHVYAGQGNYPEALKSLLIALRIDEATGNREGIAGCYANMAVIYGEQGDQETALKYHELSLKVSKEIGDTYGIAGAYNNIGNLHTHRKDYALALENYSASLKMKEEMNDLRGMASTYNNIGTVYSAMAETETEERTRSGYLEVALKNCKRSMEIRTELGDKAGMASAYGNMGGIYLRQKLYREAGEALQKAKALSEETGYKENLKETFRLLSELEQEKGNFKAAYEFYGQYISCRDSLNNEETRKKTIQSQLSYDFEKKEAVAEAEHKKELESQELLAEEKSRKQRMILFFVLGSLVLMLVFAGFIFRSLRLARKQKDIIAAQKDVVERQKQEVALQKELAEEKQKEILDSIHYAKRIQRSQLPTEVYVERCLRRLNS